MAVRFDMLTDAVSVTSGLPTAASYTLTMWAYLEVNRNAYSNPLEMKSSATDGLGDAMYLGTGVDGVSMGAATNSNSTATVTLSVGTWYRLAVVVSGTSLTMYCAPVGVDMTLAAYKKNVTAAALPASHAKMWLGKDEYEGWWNGRIAAFKMWSGALSEAQIVDEFTQFAPKVTSGLVRYHRFSTTSLAADAPSPGGTADLVAGSTAIATAADPAGIPESAGGVAPTIKRPYRAAVARAANY